MALLCFIGIQIKKTLPIEDARTPNTNLYNNKLK